MLSRENAFKAWMDWDLSSADSNNKMQTNLKLKTDTSSSDCRGLGTGTLNFKSAGNDGGCSS